VGLQNPLKKDRERAGVDEEVDPQALKGKGCRVKDQTFPSTHLPTHLPTHQKCSG
jgi:hypothetical protein